MTTVVLTCRAESIATLAIVVEPGAAKYAEAHVESVVMTTKSPAKADPPNVTLVTRLAVPPAGEKVGAGSIITSPPCKGENELDPAS
jgi:hypothetical protein